MPMPADPKIYHIVHFDRLPSIIADGHLWCDAEMVQHNGAGTTIGMSTIKQRRLELTLASHPTMRVGDCVPFYFCPRSVMLYQIYKANDPELAYRGGQEPIVHLEADLRRTVGWAEEHHLRWAFTGSNAGARYFEDWGDLGKLDELDWDAVQATHWPKRKEGKQAKFLIEHRFPWELATRIGVCTQQMCHETITAVEAAAHKPSVEIRRNWYY